MMNPFLEQATSRVSVRNFTDQKVSDELLATIFDAMVKTATSNFRQQASVLRVTDPKKRQQIADLSNQPYLVTAPELLIFIADNHRNISLARELGVDVDQRTSDVDVFFQAMTDAILMAQNTANIIESLGLGTVFLGSILNDAASLIEILELPQLTFPILGLAFGHFDHKPAPKPKLGAKLRVFENSYPIAESYRDELEEYNNATKSYYRTQRSDKATDDFFRHVVVTSTQNKPLRNLLLDVARAQGYRLG